MARGGGFWRGAAVFPRGAAGFGAGGSGVFFRGGGVFCAGDVWAEFFAQGAGRKRVLTQPDKAHQPDKTHQPDKAHQPGKAPPMRRTNKNRGFGHAEKMKKDIDKENYLC